LEVLGSQGGQDRSKQNYCDPSVTRPTAWTALNVKVGPGLFCEWFRLNNLTGLSYAPTDGTLHPIDVATKRGELNAIRDYKYPCSESAFKALIEGKTLRLNVKNDQNIPVEISGYRWLPDYTNDNDTDFLLQDGFAFMQWQTILELNYIVQIYVNRNEGSLPPPEKARNEAWNSLMVNDAFANSSFYIPA